MSNKEKCENCKFWTPMYGSPNYERESWPCRRYPPVMKDSRTQFPLVPGREWCGEFKDFNE